MVIDRTTTQTLAPMARWALQMITPGHRQHRVTTCCTCGERFDETDGLAARCFSWLGGPNGEPAQQCGHRCHDQCAVLSWRWVPEGRLHLICGCHGQCQVHRGRCTDANYGSSSCCQGDKHLWNAAALHSVGSRQTSGFTEQMSQISGASRSRYLRVVTIDRHRALCRCLGW